MSAPYSAKLGSFEVSPLPSWAEISSLSDEELYELYEASDTRFPQPLSCKSTYVRRIASDAVMKFGPLEDSEPYTMALRAMIMDFIAGQTLEDRWEALGFWQCLRLVWTIRRYIRQLRQVVVPGTPRSEQFPGRLGGSPQLCYGSMFSDMGGGPYTSYSELTSWFDHMLDVNRRVRKTPTEDVSFDSSLPLVLTHLDLHPSNIIIDENSRIWLIDWEFAGFYPQWFEYAEMQNGWDILGRWKRLIIGFMAGYYQAQTNFLVSIGWAIQMGFLL